MSDELETYTIDEIASIINERSTGTVVSTDARFDHLDVDDKVGKEVFGPLADEGVYVTTVLPKENGVRLWFEERSE